MSIVTNYLPTLLRSHITTISDVNLPPSSVNLFLICAVYCVEIELEKTFFSLSERAFEIILLPTFNKEMISQFLMYLLSLSYFLLIKFFDERCNDLERFPQERGYSFKLERKKVLPARTFPRNELLDKKKIKAR